MKTIMIVALVAMGAGFSSAEGFGLAGMDLKAVRERAAEMSMNPPRAGAVKGDRGNSSSEKRFLIFDTPDLTKEEAFRALKVIFEAANPCLAEVLCGKYAGKLFLPGNGDVVNMNMELVCKAPDFGPLFNAAPELRVVVDGMTHKAVSTPEGLAFSSSGHFSYLMRQYGDYLIIRETFNGNMVSYGYFWLP